MPSIKKMISLLVSASLLFHMLPLNILAEESGEGRPASFQTEEALPESTPGSALDVQTPAAGESFGEPALNEGEPSAESSLNAQTPAGEESVEESASIVEEPQEESSLNDEDSTSGNPLALAASDEEELVSAAEDVTPAARYSNAFANLFAELLIEQGFATEENIKTILEESESGIKLTVETATIGILALLSQQEQTEERNYKNWTINFNITGAVILPEDYQGLGDEGFPFSGSFVGGFPSISTSRTIFKALSADAEFTGATIAWSGPADQPILANTLVAGNEDRALSLGLASSSSFSPYIGTVKGGTGTVTLSALNYTVPEGEDIPQTPVQGNRGLVCNQMESGTRLKLNGLSQNGQQIDLRGTENVGSLVGWMAPDASLTITNPVTLTSNLVGKVTGGLVGRMDTGAVLHFEEGASVTLSSTQTAGEAAGGIAGQLETSTGPLTGKTSVILKSLRAVGTGENSSVGVLYGSCTATGEFSPLAGVTLPAENADCTVSGPGSCGGVFGTLTLTGEGKCTISGTESESLAINATVEARSTTAFGGLVGTLTGEARKNALVVKDCNVTSQITGTSTEYYPLLLGGLAAKQETVTLDAGNCIIQIPDPKTNSATGYGFGGLTAKLGDRALLIGDTIKVGASSYALNPSGGGVAGSTGQGSIVYLKNQLDLSECVLTTNASTGQIVGKQDCSLIYAPDVAITRNPGTGQGLELDDIGNYGELYRLPGFLQVGENYTVTLLTLSKTGNGYTFNNAEDYACFALAWQSRGCFPTVDGIDNKNWSDLKSASITLGADIDLTGRGVGGLTRDVDSNDDKFTGTLNGGSHTITLDIGADNQANTPKLTKGGGRIYWHNATGLFAVLDSGATVSDLTLAGSVRVSNTKQAMYSGALAARLSGNSTLMQVSTEAAFDVLSNGGNGLYLGGLIGQINAANAGTLNLTGLSADITLKNTGNGSYNHVGGAIGAIDKNSSVTIVCDGTTLAGAIKYINNSNNIYAGGLVGTIFPGGSGKREIQITNLNVNGFALTGTASERMGGILGGIWADTDVTIDGLTVSSAILTAGGVAKLGGLVYRASGKWTVSSADLSGLTIHAANAAALGLLVCQGGSYKDGINGTNQDIDGLYLEMTEHWAWNDEEKKGYNVPSVIAFNGSVFDEFVAYTAYADRSSDTPNYQITANGAGIISLQTDNDAVNMTAGDRNTYVNRTTAGQTATTNQYSRYYYNLPEVRKSCKGGSVDTPEELLLWSVVRYAAGNLKPYLIERVETDLKSTVIGGSSSDSRANFDMDGFSYYPISITNSGVTVQYADIKFYNADIEEKEAGNKSTRGNSTSHSQHYTMHCGLFLNFDRDLTNTTDFLRKKLTVNGVTFAGTVGVVNGSSGALLCGTVTGAAQGGNSASCQVILADEDNVGNAVTLNGLSVFPEGDYTPVLIGSIGTLVELKANYVNVTAEQTGRAGSSLIGNVGGPNATGVSIEFAGTIKLPENGGVFTKATLLNSLRYASGSASYHFLKNKDYDENNSYLHNATHGRELSTTVEYAGKQGCYYDGYGEGYYISTNFSFDAQNDFTSLLPYVALSPATGGEHTTANNWHELAVNVLSTNLTEGCGTYGHPYQVDANLLKEIAQYINSGKANEGWQVRVGKGDAYHSQEGDTYDEVITYTDGVWKKFDGSDYSGDVQAYLAGAYYAIKGDCILTDFQGLGTNGAGSIKGLPFTGVITGKLNDGSRATVTLTGGSISLINYSYGCVVRDVNIVLDQSPTLSYIAPDDRTKPQAAPAAFFGGVIGCVLGGDNILDSVSLIKGDEFSVEPTTEKSPHLVPVGGYVGVIAGGGVLFRGTFSYDTCVTGGENQLFRNPIIGRVLGGYAFYEGDGVAPDNGNKDYKINKITPCVNDLSWDGSALTVNSAQGLLVLSAIVSSGGASKDSLAYSKGKARNAKYDQIGSATEPQDYTQARSDEGAVWLNGQPPYLLKAYAGYNGAIGLCTTGINIAFAKNVSFDMKGYGNGYRGLSARYVSNAALYEKPSSDGPSIDFDAALVVLQVKTFDGGNTTVQNIQMGVQEYADDDFHAASLGGIFNIVWTEKQSGGGKDGSNFAQNLTLQDCTVSLKYIDSDGVEQNESTLATFAYEAGKRAVSVGGFIGMANDVDAQSGSFTKNNNYLFSNIHINGTSSESECSIYGPNGAGGLIGATAMASTGVTGYPGKLLANGKWALFGPSFLNCSFSNIKVSGGLAAGGLVGDAYAAASGTVPNFSGLGISYSTNFQCYTSCTVTDENLIVGQNATITARAKASVAGGLFGAAGMRVGVNDPKAGEKSGISIITTAGAVQPLQLSNVTVQASQINFNADGSNPDTGSDNIENAYVGGIIGRIGSVNPVVLQDIQITGGSILSTIATKSRVGGIVGSGYTNSTNTMQRCQIDGVSISGSYAGGFLGYGYDTNTFALYMQGCKLTGSTVNGTSYSGGLVGYAGGSYYLSNVLLKNSSITGKNPGRLFGYMNTDNNKFKLEGAGISIYADPSCKDILIPQEIEGKRSSPDNSYTGFLAYADYVGTENPVDGKIEPYVTVNPNFQLTADKLLTGDAVGKILGDSYGSIAARIWADSKTGATDKKNLTSYAKAAAIVNTEDKASPEISTFQEVQGCGPELPVLTLRGGASGGTMIQDYLDVITNGAYSEALKLGKAEVNVSVYAYSEKEQKFVLQDPSSVSASVYYDSIQKTLNVRGSSFDNTRDRFSLVEVTFTADQGTNKNNWTYTVSVPVVVIRELQCDFMATFYYGSEFHAATFQNLNTHVLESTGNPFTGYLTYQYNRKQGVFWNYDWESYINDENSNLLNIDKKLNFAATLPQGTQMILIDPQNKNKAYQYETTKPTDSVLLSQFVSVSNTDEHFSSSMADILGVTLQLADDGQFVVTEKPSEASLKREDTYYRHYKDGDTGPRYKVTVPDLSQADPREDYYLVITVPEQSAPDYSLNGALTSTLVWEMPSSVTQVHRYNPSERDSSSNTESTYSIFAGYEQTLESKQDASRVDMSLPDSTMQVSFKDTITFSNQQNYNAKDPLYVKFQVSAQKYEKNSAAVTEQQFPTGTFGTINFYVRNEDGSAYYAYDEKNGWTATPNKEKALISYDWSSRGGSMELPLSQNGQDPLNLAPVRTAIKGSNNTGASSIVIEAEMKVQFLSQEVINEAVPASGTGSELDAWVQLYYTGMIATQSFSLDYSSMRESKPDPVQYYRGVTYQAILSMDASKIDQLGVNPLQPVETYLSMRKQRQTSRIDLTVALDLADLQEPEQLLEKSARISFALSLKRRKGSGYEEVDAKENLIDFDWEDAALTIFQEDFYQNGQAVTTGYYQDEQFIIPLTAFVFMDQTDFANYQICVAVSFWDEQDQPISVSVNGDAANVVYTYACIHPTFYDPSP